MVKMATAKAYRMPRQRHSQLTAATPAAKMMIRPLVAEYVATAPAMFSRPRAASSAIPLSIKANP